MAGTKKQDGKEYSENWGGARSNLKGNVGRKATGRKYRTFSFSCSPEEYGRIKALIEESGLKPSRFFVKKCLE